MKKKRTIETIQILNKIKKRNKFVSFFLVLIILVSVMAGSVITVSARTNSWGLNTGQVATSYFVNSQRYLSSGWSVNRQNAWIECKNTTSSFNYYVIATDDELNVVKLLEKLYEKDQNKAVELAEKWNTEFSNVQNLVTEASEQCAYETKIVTLYSGEEVTEAIYDALFNEAKTIYKEIQELFTEIQETTRSLTYEPSEVFNNNTNMVFSFFDRMWSALGVLLNSFGLGNANTDNIFGTSFTTDSIETFANSISGIVKTFAYATICTLFAVNVTTTSLQYELLTLKGGVKIFARVLIAKFWVDLAIPICMYTLKIINSLASQILAPYYNPGGILFGSYGGSYTSSPVNNNWWDFLGVIVNFLSNAINFIPNLILMIVVVICIASVFIKLIARCFELTCLVSLSPLFFATLVGDETKHYFKKFFGAFLSCGAYIVYLVIVYAVGSTWVKDVTTVGVIGDWGAFLGAIATVFPRTLVLIAICNVMRKPPKVLTSLVG